MKEPTIKFNTTNNPEFFKVLRNRVNLHFEETKRSKKGNFNMKFKSLFMLSLYIIPYLLMITGVVSSPGLVLLMWVLMGFGMSGIGLSIMHDANHGSYSTRRSARRCIPSIRIEAPFNSLLPVKKRGPRFYSEPLTITLYTRFLSANSCSPT